MVLLIVLPDLFLRLFQRLPIGTHLRLLLIKERLQLPNACFGLLQLPPLLVDILLQLLFLLLENVGFISRTATEVFP